MAWRHGPMAAAILVAAVWTEGALAQPTTMIDTRYVVAREGVWPSGGLHEATLLIWVRERGQPPVWVVERRLEERNFRETTMRHDWVDGRRCPALAEIKALPPVRFAEPAQPSQIPPFHAIATTLKGQAAFEESATSISRTESKGPVSDWWRAADIALKPCRQEAPVVVGGKPIEARLTSREVIEQYSR